ncbi:MAG: ribonuclease P protein component [Pseudomonadota bacterium]
MQRLKSRAQFQATMSGGTVARTAHFVLHRVSLDAANQAAAAASADKPSSSGPESFRPQALFAVQDCWMGPLVPKRWAKRAVTRNTIKRQIYNVSASFEHRLPKAAHVVRLRSTFDRKVFISATSDALKLAVRTELEELFAKAVAA